MPVNINTILSQNEAHTEVSNSPAEIKIKIAVRENSVILMMRHLTIDSSHDGYYTCY